MDGGGFFFLLFLGMSLGPVHFRKNGYVGFTRQVRSFIYSLSFIFSDVIIRFICFDVMSSIVSVPLSVPPSWYWSVS